MPPGEGQQATSVADSAAHNTWVSAGSEGSTPAPAAAPSAPDPAPSAPPAPAPSAPAPAAEAPKTLAQRGREWIGRAVPSLPTKAPAPGSPAPTSQPKASEAVAAAAAAAGQTTQEYLEALLDGDERLQIPLTARIPIKRGGQTELVSIRDFREDLMRQRDYTVRTQAFADERRAFDEQRRQHAAETARAKAEREQFEAERREYEEALADPQKWELWQQHMEAYRTNPIYRSRVDQARESSVNKAEIAAIRETDQQRAVETAAERVQTAIEQMATEFPDVDPLAVRQAYAQALSLGQAELNVQSLRSFFEAEAQRVTQYAGPLRSEVEELKRQIAELTQQRSAEHHNTETARVLNRDKLGKFVAPAGGAPVNPGRQPATPFTSAELPQRKRAWITGG